MQRREFLQGAGALAAGALLTSNAFADNAGRGANMEVSPNWNDVGTPLSHSWEGLGNIDQMRWMTRKDCLEHLELAHRELGMRHVRAVGIHHDDLFMLGSDPKNCLLPNADDLPPRRNWQVLDYIFDSLLDIGISPMYTTAFTPSTMASGEQYVFKTKCNVTPPKDYNAWAELVTATLQHCLWRYGKQRMDEWYYEVWNEPNLNAFYGGDQQEFFKLWEVTSKAIKSVDSDWRVGGPSTARAEWIGDFLDDSHRRGCPPDYIIAHCYNNDSEWAALSPFDGLQEDKTNQSPHFLPGVVAGVNKLLADRGYSNEVHWNEWGRSWFPFDEMRETANEAAFIGKTMAEVAGDAKYFAYWCLSDIYNQAGYGKETFHGNYGLLNLQGLKKPSYFAFQLLGMLGDRSLPHDGAGVDRLNNALVSKNGGGSQVLVYSYNTAYEVGGPSQKKTVHVALPAPVSGNQLKLYQVSNDENNVITRWKQAGSPDYLKYGEKHAWREENVLRPSAQAVTQSERDGKHWVSFDIDSPSLALLTVEGPL